MGEERRMETFIMGENETAINIILKKKEHDGIYKM